MSIPLLYGTLVVTVVRAKGLKNTDTSILSKKNLSDPYVVVGLDSVKVCKTKVHDDNLNPEFNESKFAQYYKEIKKDLILEH